MEKEGFEVKLVDAPARHYSLRKVLGIVKKFKPKMVVIETSTPSIYNDIKVAEAIKKVVKTFIVLVGTHVSSLPEETLKLSKKIDAVVRKEYDYTIRDLVYVLKKERKLNKALGISYRKNKKIVHNPDRPFIENLDELPFVTSVYKKHLNIEDYFFAAAEYPMVMIMTGRGCPFRCFFCVDGNTLIITKKRGKIFVEPIKDFIDPLIKIQSEKIGTNLVSEVKDVKILSEEGKFVEIKNISRSTVKKKVYLIRLKKGIYLKLTEDHLIP
ncbi:MAG: cobalamin-dependent protein, partial [Methanosarcinales archaeon]